MQKTTTATNRRGTAMTGAQVLEEIKLSKEIRDMLKRMLNQQGIYSRRDLVQAIVTTALSVTVIFLLVWVWYFAVS